MMSSSANLLKYGSLAIVIPHSITYSILGAVSRRPDANGNVFYGPSAVFLMEIGKLIISLIGITLTLARTSSSQSDTIATTKRVEEETSDESLLLPHSQASSQASSPFASPWLEGYSDEKQSRRRSVGGSGQFSVLFEAEKETQDQTAAAAVIRYSSSSSKDNEQTSLFQRVQQEILTRKAFRLCAPALLYALQNNFQVFAAGCLTPAEYQILTQLKLVAGAMFSVLILRKRLNSQRWLSIFTLTIGVSIVQYYSLTTASKNEAAAALTLSSSSTTTTNDEPIIPLQQTIHQRTHFDLVIGTALMIGASACSGLAGVLIEALLKGSNSIWTTNVHLATFSLLSASVPIIADIYAHNGHILILRHFNKIVWTLIAFNMAGGVMMAMVLKYADNILEKFAVAISLVGTVLLSSFVSHIPLHASQWFGAAVVMASALSYGLA